MDSQKKHKKEKCFNFPSESRKKTFPMKRQRNNLGRENKEKGWTDDRITSCFDPILLSVLVRQTFANVF